MSTDPASPVRLTSVPSELEASVIANALCDLGFRATTTGGFTSGFKAEAPGDVMILVPAEELEKARQALSKIQTYESNVDWSQIDVGSPENGDEDNSV